MILLNTEEKQLWRGSVSVPGISHLDLTLNVSETITATLSDATFDVPGTIAGANVLQSWQHTFLTDGYAVVRVAWIDDDESKSKRIVHTIAQGKVLTLVHADAAFSVPQDVGGVDITWSKQFEASHETNLQTKVLET